LWNFKRFVHVGTGAWNVIAEFVGKGGELVGNGSLHATGRWLQVREVKIVLTWQYLGRNSNSTTVTTVVLNSSQI
jgi:hypothetical protein